MTEIVKKNINKEPGTFYEVLYENGLFDLEKFNQITGSIFKLSKEKIDPIKRLKMSVELWEFGFLIEELIANHFNTKDKFKIENLNNEQISALNQLIYYLCNWFSYNKEIEEKLLYIETWTIK